MKITKTRLPYVAALAIILSFFSLFLLIKTATDQNKELMEASAYKSVERGLKREQKFIESIARDLAWWDDTITNAVVAPNIDWVYKNLGNYAYQNFDMDYVSILNEELIPIFQFRKSNIYNAPLMLDGSLDNLLKQTFRTHTFADDGPDVVSGIIVIHEKVMLVSASRLMQEEDKISPELFKNHFLLVGKELGGNLLKKMEYELSFDHLGLVNELSHEHEMSSLNIKNYNSEIIAHLHMVLPEPKDSTSTSIAMYISLMILGLSSILTLIIAFRAAGSLNEKHAAIALLTEEASERKKAQERIEAFQEELKQEVEMRTFELKEEQQQLLSIFNASADGIITIDNKGIIQRLNPAVSNIFGYEENELIGVGLEILLCAQDKKNHQSYVDKSNLYSARVINKTRLLWALHKDGHRFAIDLNVAPIKGNKKGFVGVLRDISDRAELEKEREKTIDELKNVIETTTEGFIRFNHNGIVEQVNSAFCEMLGKTSNELVDMALHELIHPDDIDSFIREKEVCDANGQHSCQLKLKTSSGVGKFALKATRVHRDQELDGYYFAFVSDVTEVFQYQEELLSARNEAQRANLAKSEFLSSMSHELRTPLNAIIGFAQLLGSSKRDTLSERQKKQVNHILNGGQHLLTLINDILDLARIESGKMSLSIEPVDPIPVIKECMSFVKGMAEDKLVKLNDVENICSKYLVDTDYTRLKQILINLINNAIKYNVENGSVSVRVVMHGHNLRISVTDTGMGIPNNLQPELFKPFSRLGNENSEIEGTGIGLTLTKKLVREMSGDIGFESEEGKGSTFWVDLPVSKKSLLVSEVSHKNVDSSIPYSLSIDHHILYIEDNPANQELMQQMLEEYGDIKLSIASSAEIGLQLAFSEKPELILMDINLPGMNGVDATKQLKKSQETSHIPIVAVTANAMSSMEKKAKEAGCDDYLIKPIQIAELESMLSLYLGLVEKVDRH